MYIDSINNGFVIDHIPAGAAMRLYDALGLGEVDAPVAIIKNAPSHRQGRKDIIKVDCLIDINFDLVGYIAPDAVINVIKDGERVEKRAVEVPARITNVVKCQNPHCITTVEAELDQVFKLTDPDKRVYRCAYCEAKAA
ncbi:MAG: aspartate carbamoyltransferase regulatory subunit [Actinomycetaceae bacterium]|nr:aspartate carbamoyltransferase regulatory subunit [Arcanobacterium sp.]MDD7504557.1 aspartate carbamoyltransferase regulatory subunit [Actinomycetaceae bacterium]MDY6143200.1 aspartate carbamoyltransferase regulatory subunit [Arcanobacterium sp.]